MSTTTSRARSGPNRTGLYDEITATIIAELEAGRVPWVQPCGTAAAKASLVRAGVLPQLRRPSEIGAIRSPWVIVLPIMAGRGLDGLALALAQAFKMPVGRSATRMCALASATPKICAASETSSCPPGALQTVNS